jgi:trehalose 6-phosphate phosphatase
MKCTPELTRELLGPARRLWLFLDYDGTLADFAPTPEFVEPVPAVLDLLSELVEHPRLRVAVVSGRRLAHVRSLLPVPGLLLAGTYGVELQTPEGEWVERVDYADIRPRLEALKPCWEQLIAERDKFFLEDKGWAMALHARFAGEEEAHRILGAARDLAVEAASSGPFRVLGGHKFLEIGPKLAHKGQTVQYLLERYPFADAKPLYLGDDDKDEEAFGVVKAHGGIAVLVTAEPQDTQADCCLESPYAAHRWLSNLPAYLDK